MPTGLDDEVCREVVAVLTTEADASAPAFSRPTRLIGSTHWAHADDFIGQDWGKRPSSGTSSPHHPTDWPNWAFADGPMAR